MITALVDGVPISQIAVSDSSVLRGDGCFEACRSYGGVLFGLDRHLVRLERSAAALDLPLPDRSTLAAWMAEVCPDEDGMVRVVVTRGDAIPGGDGRSRVVVLSHPLPKIRPALALCRVWAPWHPAGRTWSLAGAKTISYAPNVAATRQANQAGFDDGVLVSDDGVVLEGPTFTIGWVVAGRVETPSLDLEILDSISRQVVLEEADRLKVAVDEVEAPWNRLAQADEVFAMSTVKEVTPVERIGGRTLESGPVTARLAGAFRARVLAEVGQPEVAGQDEGEQDPGS